MDILFPFKLKISYCLIVFVVVLLVLWIFFGGKKHPFIGIDFSQSGEKHFNRDEYSDDYQEFSNEQFLEENRYINDDDHKEIITKKKRRKISEVGEQISTNKQINNENKINDDFVPTKLGRESKGERKCRKTIEELFRVNFARQRPNNLINPLTGRRLELDCFNSSLSLAVEYNGVQHYKWPNFFHKTKDEFIQQIGRDRFKRDFCDKNGIYLIVVPYTVKESDIKQFILSKLPKDLKDKLSL